MTTVLWILLILIVAAGLYVFLALPNLPRRPLDGLTGRDYAHRGLWDDSIPENSLPAFRRAAELGFGIETDVHITRDDQLVVFHDDSLERMCGDPRMLADLTLAELRELRLKGTDERIPTFDEFLAAVDERVPVIVEIKTDKRIGLLCEMTDRRLRTYRGVYCVESFDPRAVRWYRLHRPDIIRGQLAFGLVKPGTWPHTLTNRLLASLMQNVLGRPDFIAFDAETDRSLPMRLQRRLRPSFVAWTVRSQRQMDSLRGRYDLQIFERFVPGGRPED